MSFKVKFESSAIYQTADPVNQYDIDKLFGFSEGYNHHLNSARLGWAWHTNALHLYGNVYSDSIRAMIEIASVTLVQSLFVAWRLRQAAMYLLLMIRALSYQG